MDQEQDIRDIAKNVNHILQLLQGNQLDKSDTGLIGSVKDMITRVIKLEKWRDRLVAGIVGLSIPAGIGIKEIILGIKNLMQ